MIGLGDQPDHASPRQGSPGPIGLLPGRLLRSRVGDVDRSRDRGKNPGRSGRVAVGTVDDPRRPDQGGAWYPRDVGGRDRAFPRQGGDEAGARRDRDPHPSPLQRPHGPRDLGCARPGRLPGDHQTDCRGRFGGHLPGERAQPGREDHPRAWPYRRGQRRGVHRRRRVHLRHDLLGRQGPLLQHLLVPPPAPDRKAERVDQPADGGPAESGCRPSRRSASSWACECSRR